MDSPLSEKDDDVSVTLSGIMRLPRELRCQIISNMRTAEQIYLLYKADHEGQLHKVIIECTKEIIVNLNSKYIDQLIPFLLVLENLVSITIIFPNTGMNVYKPFALSQLMEVAKLKHLKEFIFSSKYHEGFFDMVFLTNYCRGLTTRVDRRGIIKVQQLNRNFDDVHFAFPSGFVLRDNIIRSSDWQTQYLVIENSTIIKGITLLSEGSITTLNALEEKMKYLEVLEIIPENSSYIEADMLTLFQNSPIRIIRGKLSDFNEIRKFSRIILQLPPIGTLQEISVPILLINLAGIVGRYKNVNTIMVFVQTEEIESAPSKIEKVLDAYPHIELIIINLEGVSHDFYDNFDTDDDYRMTVGKFIIKFKNLFDEIYHDRIKITIRGD